MIESGRFKWTTLENERLLIGEGCGGTLPRVILCTISMLSTSRLMQRGFTEIVPVQTIIIDEASQIEVGDYLPILAMHATTLRKMVFIGDDKQCMCGWWIGSWCADSVSTQWPLMDKRTSRF